MRILFVTHAYPRWDGDVAGAFIERLAVALVERGHSLSVVAPSDRGKGGEDLRRGVRVRRVRYASARAETLAYRGTMVRALRSPVGIFAVAALLRALTRAVRDVDCDVVHAHWWVPGGIAAWRGAKAPYVVTLHGTDVALLGKFAPIRPLARGVLSRAARVTTVSSYLAQEAARWSGYTREILVQPMPIDVARAPARGGGGIVTVGRLTRQKRTDLALEAVARLRQQGVIVPLTVIGDGPELRSLERKAGALGIAGTTRFVGAIAPEALPAILGEADVMAFPAQHEGFGLAPAEALLLGIPVVAMTDGGGVLDIVPRSGAGRVVPAGDVNALAHALVDLIDDARARPAAVELAHELRERLSPEAAATVIERCYEEAVRAEGAS